MVIIKSHTDLHQSKKLAEILPVESADMVWQKIYDENHTMSDYRVEIIPYRFYSGIGVPCWSLTALLSVLPKIGAEEPMVKKLYYANEPKERYICEYGLTNITSEYNNPIDACVAMIEKLHELKLL